MFIEDRANPEWVSAPDYSIWSSIHGHIFTTIFDSPSTPNSLSCQHSLAVQCLSRDACVHLCTFSGLLLQVNWHRWAGICRSGLTKHYRDGMETLETFSVLLYLSFSFWLCLCLLPTSAFSQSLAGQPVQRGFAHAPTAAVQQQERASSAFTCRSCLQPLWGWILLSSLITVVQAEINLQHSITLGFVYEMVSQEQIHWGGLFKGFLFWTMVCWSYVEVRMLSKYCHLAAHTQIVIETPTRRSNFQNNFPTIQTTVFCY